MKSFCKQKKAPLSPPEGGNVCVCLAFRPQTHLVARLQVFSELFSWDEEEEDVPLRRPQQGASGPEKSFMYYLCDHTHTHTRSSLLLFFYFNLFKDSGVKMLNIIVSHD